MVVDFVTVQRHDIVYEREENVRAETLSRREQDMPRDAADKRLQYRLGRLLQPAQLERVEQGMIVGFVRERVQQEPLIFGHVYYVSKAAIRVLCDVVTKVELSDYAGLYTE